MKIGPRKHIKRDREKNIAYVLLGKGKTAIIDLEDTLRVGRYKWGLQGAYAARKVKVDGKQERIFLHRVLMWADEGEKIDHINGDPLDNRKSNLRFATHQQNTWNRKRSTKNTSGCTGVCFNPEAKAWRARIGFNGKKVFLGEFKSFDDAVAARLAAERKYYGEFARG